MSRREQDGIEAKVRDRDDERLKRDEMRHSDEWSRWVCMGLVRLFQEVQDFFAFWEVTISPCMNKIFCFQAADSHLAVS